MSAIVRGSYVRCINGHFCSQTDRSYVLIVGEIFEVDFALVLSGIKSLILTDVPRFYYAASRFEPVPMIEVERAGKLAADKLRELALNLRDGGAA